MQADIEESGGVHATRRDVEKQLWEIAVRELHYASARRARFRCEQTFRGVPLAGRDVLEVGAGSGLHSAYAAVRGARRVVALEPEADGSTSGSRSVLLTLQRTLKLPSLVISPSPLESFDPAGHRFDVVLLYNSINHLDEPACSRLHRSREAWDRYRGLLRRLAGMLRPGATLIVSDCSRFNLWPTLGLKNPFAPSIEWEKHQTPRVWDEVLASANFVRVESEWYRYYPLRWLGPLSTNALAAFVLAGHFRLVRRFVPADEPSQSDSTRRA